MNIINRSGNVYFFLLFIISSVLFYINYEQRHYGWDMPGYLASYHLAEDSLNKKELVREVYTSIQLEAPKSDYEKMVGNYQKENWNYFITTHPDAFHLQIPYYSIKVFYVFLIFFFHKIGFSAPIAVFLPNLISFFIFGFLLFAIFKRIFVERTLLSFSLTVLLLLIPPFRYLATIPSPDMLATALITWFFYSVISNQHLRIQFMILLLVVFTRPDFVIFGLSYLGIYFLYDWFTSKKINFLSIVLGLVMVAVYLLILKVNSYPGWTDVFYDTFIERRRFVTGAASFALSQYNEIILENIFNFKKITFLAVLFLSAVFYFTKDLWTRMLAVILFINIYIKFLFFPAPGEYRFFIAFLLLLFLTAVYAAQNKIRKLTF